MNQLKVFENPAFGQVRTTVINDEPWFVGKDVALALGYKEPSKAAREKVDPEDRGVSEMDTPSGKQDMTIINESGLYSLVLSSKLPKAKEFKRWVTSDVLPTIRRHGTYMTGDVLEQALLNPDYLVKLAQQLKTERDERRRLEDTVAVQNQQLSECRPKASYYDVVLNCKDLISVTTIAKDYGWSAKRLNQFLHDQKVQFKQGANWILYQKYAEMGLTNTKTQTYNGADGEVHSKVHTYWTQKGRLFIYDLMKEHGHLPLIEARS